MNDHEHSNGDGHYVCPTCQQHIERAMIDVIDIRKAVEADRLTEADVFKRTYLGHGTQSSVFVFQGHPGPFRTHVHETHDEIGYVLQGTGEVHVGGVVRPVKQGDVWVIPKNTPHGGRFEDAPQVLFISSPIDDPDNQDRVWFDEKDSTF